jgi:tRNA A-37 threonylcarbamoyl transferase component Bud32
VNCPHCNVPNPDDARFCAACGKATSATEPVSHPGMKAIDHVGKEIAGRYRITTKLGEGGMGAVYKAEQISLKRQCAVKLLRAEVASTELMLRRFDAEAKAVASLSHPNTVNIYDFGQDTDGTFFIAMEYVEGKSLREVIHTEAPLPLRRALSIASQVASSLSDAHSHNIIHRDLKPDNVMLQTRGRQKDVARVLDFGIAKLRDEGRATQAAMTQAGDMLGTPQYMAPEQIRAEQIDGRTDVYALGCMLYEMITGRMPFEGATVLAILSKHLTETPVAPSQRRPDLQIPPAIDQLVMAAVAKDRNARPPTMELFGEQIAAMLAQFPSESGQGTAQMSAQHGAQLSAQVGVPVPPTMASYGATPGQPYGAYAPPTAPPAPGGYVPAPGYGTPQPGPYGAAPYGAAPTPPPMPAMPLDSKPSGGMGKLLIIALGALVLIGGGIGIFFAMKKDTPAVTVADAGTVATADAADKAEPDKPEKPDKPDKVEEPVKPDKPDPPDPDPPDPEEDEDKLEPDKDPWAGGAAGTDDAQLAQVLTAMTEMKTKMCACKDATCVAQVSQSATKWAHTMASLAPKLASMDPAKVRKLSSIQAELGQCVQRAMQPKTAPAEVDLNAEIDKIANRACACRDVTCGRRSLAELVALARKHKGNDKGDEARAEASGTRMVQCLMKLGVTQQELQSALLQIQ